jgi:hypothetical protein
MESAAVRGGKDAETGRGPVDLTYMEALELR